MPVFQRFACRLLVLILVVVTVGRCQQESRRAVSEHQLMHNRGRNIQSLKRLIWLSSAMEGLHTAQTRSTDYNPSRVLDLDLNPELVSAAQNSQSARMQAFLTDFFYPYLNRLSDGES